MNDLPCSEATIEEKNELIGQQVIHLIQEIHQDLRPFILIFPHPKNRDSLQAFTNITSVQAVREVLRSHLRATKEMNDLVTLPPNSLN